MAITLTAEQEEQIREIAQNRGFASAEEYLNQLMARNYESEMAFVENREEFNKLIDEAWEEMERGEFVTPEQLKADLDEAKRDFLVKRSAAA